jgi:hypothetical protein
VDKKIEMKTTQDQKGEVSETRMPVVEFYRKENQRRQMGGEPTWALNWNRIFQDQGYHPVRVEEQSLSRLVSRKETVDLTIDRQIFHLSHFPNRMISLPTQAKRGTMLCHLGSAAVPGLIRAMRWTAWFDSEEDAVVFALKCGSR